ncbi:MAG: fibronectin type III domain-containing protein, partial [Bacteroidales bacterium]
MRKVTCLFVAFVLSLMMIQINDVRSQVMIGNGTVTAQRLPINAYYGFSYSQVIYLASEIDASGDINAISWNFYGTSLTNSNDWTIYLGHTTKTEFDSKSDWIPIGELTQVYSGEFASPTGPGWITIPISNFTYDGTSNLVIAVDENKSSYNTSGDDFYSTAVTGNRGIVYYSDQTNPDPASPPTGTSLRAYIANVILGGIQQACPPVITLTATDISHNSANLGWTSLGNETVWNIEYGLKGFELGQGTPVSGVTTNPYLLTGLTPDTEYEFYVQADCGNGEVSSFAGPKVFKTPCEPYSTFPWNESFEYVTIPALPTCWYKYANSKWVTTNNGNSSYDADAKTGTQFLRIPYSSTNDHVWTPGFSMEAGTSYEFSFWWAGDGYAGWTGDVVMNTFQDPTGAVQIGNTFITPDVITDKIYRQFKYNFVPDESGDYYFAIRVTSTSAPWYLSFDDFTVQYTPSCTPPSDLTVGSITTNSALLGWTPGGDENLWNIEYGPAGFELGQGNLITDIADNPYLLSGLTQATAYDFYVQADCGGGELSPWFGPASFITECETMELPYFEDFTGVAVDAIPVCWTRTHNNWSVQSSSIAGGTSPEIRLYWSPSFTDLSMLQSPVFNTVGKTLLLLEFKHYLSHYGTPYTLGIKTSSDGITWNTVWEISPSANIAAETKEVIINNSDVGSPTFQFAFFFDGYIYNINNWNIDDVSLSAPEIGTLSGYVTEATRGVIVGAHVFSGSYEAFTDATGYYEIADMIVDVYDVTCEADGYVSVTEVGVEISANQVTELDFQLGIPSIFIDPESISANTEPGGLATETLTISNPEGTAPLTWSARVKILSDRQSSLPILTQQQLKVIGADEVNPNPSGVKPDCTDEMFDLLASFPVNDVGGTYSIVCDGDFLYTGRWNANGYDKYSLEGEFIEHFEIPGAGKTRDLTFDGQYF